MGFSVCIHPGNYTHIQDREHVTPQNFLVAFVPLTDTPHPPSPRFSDTSISGRGGFDQVT